jgi:hypothetical protein
VKKGFLPCWKAARCYDPVHQTFPVGGVDGITLSADRSRLYYSPLTTRRLYHQGQRALMTRINRPKT